MAGLTWLHLSDWHQKDRDFDRQVVRDALLRDVRERAKIDPALGQVDFVVFSGDAAWQGKAEEYQAAREFLFEPVLDELALQAKDLFIVPGNHDLNREHVQEMLPDALKKPLDSDEQVQKWLVEEKKRSRALEPFEAYANFSTGFTRQGPAAYANSRQLFVGKTTVGILCLNSAWMCGRIQDAVAASRQCVLSSYQFSREGNMAGLRRAYSSCGRTSSFGSKVATSENGRHVGWARGFSDHSQEWQRSVELTRR